MAKRQTSPPRNILPDRGCWKIGIYTSCFLLIWRWIRVLLCRKISLAHAKCNCRGGKRKICVWGQKNVKKISTFKNGHTNMQFCPHKAPKLSLGNCICLLLRWWSRQECLSCCSRRETVKCFTLQEWRGRMGVQIPFSSAFLGDLGRAMLSWVRTLVNLPGRGGWGCNTPPNPISL